MYVGQKCKQYKDGLDAGGKTQVRNVSGVKRCFKNVEGNTQVRSASMSVKKRWMQRPILKSEVQVGL